MDVDATITGLQDIVKALETMKGAPARRVLKSAIRGALNLVGKQMKKDVDPKVKIGATAVKSRIMERKGVLSAKVGFGVGKRKRPGTLKKVRTAGPRPKGRGVGISGQNIHWWVAGTQERTTGMRVRRKHGVITRIKLTTNQNTHSTGRMPAMQPGLAFRAYQKQAGQINAEMIKRGALQLKKEYVKLGQQR